MDARLFDVYTRAAARPRRAVAGGLLGLALTPLAVSGKRKKKKKKSKCAAPNIACGKACCASNQQCVSGQCQDPAPDDGGCNQAKCDTLTNPAMQGGFCFCKPNIGGGNLCFANMSCGGLPPCQKNDDCAEGSACQAGACGATGLCVKTCV